LNKDNRDYFFQRTMPSHVK